ncbi:MAG: TolC family protein [Flavobacteriales bacterium]|nr:TolC family protein [Flavobacteriales bacterium]
MKTPFITALVATAMFVGSTTFAQTSTIHQVLQQVGTNNKRLAAEASTLEALKLRERTGLSLPDPTVDFDYMNGTPAATAGTQQDLTVAQAFDFPTAYGARRQVAQLRTSQHEQAAIATRREVLLDAQRTCIALVYANQRTTLLADRHAAAVRFLSGVRQLFEREAATILDLHKAELLEAGIAADVSTLAMDRQALLQHLAELNGGNEVVFSDTVYPAMPAPPPFAEYEQAMEAADPTLRTLEIETAISEQQTREFKATGLPAFEVGYRYQGILGANYNGFHTGITVPLWSNRNKVKQQKAFTEASQLMTEEHRTEHFYEARHLYDRALELRRTADDYAARMMATNSIPLLEKAYEAGQLTTLAYKMELMLRQESEDRLLQLQWQSMDAMAELFKYQL